MYPNELKTELLGIHALNAFVQNNSSSRGVMFASHFSQKLTIEGATEKRIQTGAELEFAKHTLHVKMPVTGKIIRIIDRYPTSVGEDAIPKNPESYVIYEDINTHEIGCLTIPQYVSYHQYFGFPLKPTQHYSKLVPGNIIEKGTVLADSPAVTDEGGYKYGIELNMAFMSHPAVSEDGILICEDVLPRLKFKVYEKRVVEFGKNSFPLNLYGDLSNYKPFPEIGEFVREDGLIMMLRQLDDDLTPVDLSIYDVREPDFMFDKAIYGRGPNGRVIDIRVYSNEEMTGPTPTNIMVNMEKYSKAMRAFYKEVIDLEHRLTYERKKKYGNDKLPIKPEFHQLVMESLVHLDNGQHHKKVQKLNLEYRKVPLDEYRVEFVIEYTITPTVGYKLTDSHGGKGVICKIEKSENMPRDANGNRADIVMDAASTISRMNLGRVYEQYIGAAARDMSQYIRATLQCHEKQSYKLLEEIKQWAQQHPNEYRQLIERLRHFYSLICDTQATSFVQFTEEEKYEHLADIVIDGIYIYLPIENQKEIMEVVKDLEQHYPPCYSPVTYVGNSGRRVTTRERVRIGPIYMMLLEKIADDWSSVSSGKLQHFGVLSPVTKSEKYAYPWRNSPVRTLGEAEARIMVCYCGREAIAEMMDRSNNPLSHKFAVWTLLNSKTPGRIDEVIDRQVIPLGGAKPLQLLKHIAMCTGWRPVYIAED